MTADQLHDCESVHGYVERICFKNGPPSHIGAELELLLAGADPSSPVSLAHVRAGLLEAPRLPGGSSLTFEPGGQVELSSPAAPVTHLARHRCRRPRCALAASSGGRRAPGRSTSRSTPADRRRGSSSAAATTRWRPTSTPSSSPLSQCAHRVGRRSMMTTTAATQVNLDVGADLAARWRLLHDLGPVMVAAFANSPSRLGRSDRLEVHPAAIWQALDPGPHRAARRRRPGRGVLRPRPGGAA